LTAEDKFVINKILSCELQYVLAALAGQGVGLAIYVVMEPWSGHIAIPTIIIKMFVG
jgi:hypothetical protein